MPSHSSSPMQQQLASAITTTMGKRGLSVDDLLTSLNTEDEMNISRAGLYRMIRPENYGNAPSLTSVEQVCNYLGVELSIRAVEGHIP